MDFCSYPPVLLIDLARGSRLENKKNEKWDVVDKK
jgi:hypothetical protein